MRPHSKTKQVAQRLLAHNATLATAESCTGGLLGGELTSLPGSSEWYLGGVIAYHNRIKARALGVPEATLKTHGAVSAPVARRMAQGVRKATGATVAVSITGLAGPGGGSAQKPVGLVYIGLAQRGARPFAKEYRWHGTRSEIRRKSVLAALALLLEHLPPLPR